MKLLFITQYFPPEMGAPQARLFELARRLKAQGDDVTILTAMPNYPMGRVFDSYKGRILLKEEMCGLEVVRVWLYPSNSSRMIPRLVCYLSFALSALLIGQWRIGRQDAVLIESPPLFLVPFALLIAKLKRAKVVLNVADIWPDILVQMGVARRDSYAVRMMYWLEGFCYRHSDVITLTTPGMCEEIRRRFPKKRDIALLSNGVDTSLFNPSLRDERIRQELGADANSLLVAYCGLHGLAQGLEIVLEAADRLRDRMDIRIAMVGDGPTRDQIVRLAQQMSLPNLRLVPARPKEEMPAIVASVDVSLMPLAVRIPGAMPSKVYEALASGAVPIVAKGTDAEALVVTEGAGLAYEPGDVEQLVQQILKLADDRDMLQDMRTKAIKLAKRFDRNLLARRSREVFKAVVEGRPVPPASW